MSPDINTFEESSQERRILQIFWVEEVIYQCLELKVTTILETYWNLQVGRHFGKFHDKSVTK